MKNLILSKVKIIAFLTASQMVFSYDAFSAKMSDLLKELDKIDRNTEQYCTGPENAEKLSLNLKKLQSEHGMKEWSEEEQNLYNKLKTFALDFKSKSQLIDTPEILFSKSLPGNINIDAKDNILAHSIDNIYFNPNKPVYDQLEKFLNLSSVKTMILKEYIKDEDEYKNYKLTPVKLRLSWKPSIYSTEDKVFTSANMKEMNLEAIYNKIGEKSSSKMSSRSISISINKAE